MVTFIPHSRDEFELEFSGSSEPELIVASTSPYHLEAHAGFFRLYMKEKFDDWPGYTFLLRILN